MAERESPGHERHKVSSFGDRLEERVRDAVAKSPESREFSASSLVEEQLALTLHQIDELRRRWQALNDNLLRSECDIDTELMQMEQRTPRYSPYRYPEREKLERRLARLAEERRRLAISQAERLDSLHERLLALLQKRRQLE